MNGWHVFDKEEPEGLQDHYFYLVTHSKFKTPMKAMWHSENGGTWQVLGCWHVDESGQRHQEEEFWHSWDEDNPITAWMELPNVFQEEFTDDQLDRIDAVQEYAGDFLKNLAESDDLEFTDEQLLRLDIVEAAARQFLNTMAETDDTVWDLDDVWDLIYEASDRLTKRGRRVRIPTHVTTPDGKEFITDWYGEEEHA